MVTDFLTSFKITTIGIFQIFFIALCGYVCVKLKVISKEGVDTIGKLVINLTLPFFIFVKIVKYFNFADFAFWWTIPLLSIGMLFLSFLLATLFLPVFKIKDNIPELKSLVTFQNSGYLPLALIQTLLVCKQQEIAFIYIFLFLLGFNFIIWSLGVRYLTKCKDIGINPVRWRGRFNILRLSNGVNIKTFLTAPFVAILFSLLIVYLRLNEFFPIQLLKPMEWIGDCTIPLGILVIGAIIGETKLTKKAININPVGDNPAPSEKERDEGCLPDTTPTLVGGYGAGGQPISNVVKSIIYVILLKLIIIPSTILLILKLTTPPYLLGLIIIIQASMPSATSLAIISRRYSSNYELISSGIFITHILSLITIPLFIIFYHKLSV